ncbi:MAG: thiosulfate sulfurtransferase [Cellvibrionaceae bacterium]|jgi:thiosulfate sulfurtransferase
MTKFKDINIEAAKNLIQKKSVALADIRDLDSYNTSHIEGAIHVTNDNLQDFIQNSNLDQPLIVYCFHGHSSQPAAQFLLEQGFEETYSLIGGYTLWVSENAD